MAAAAGIVQVVEKRLAAGHSAECVGQVETVPMYYLKLTGLVLVSL